MPKTNKLPNPLEIAIQLWKSGDYKKSLIEINKAIKQKPNNTSFLGFKSMLLVRLNRIKESTTLNNPLLRRNVTPDLERLLLITKIEQLLALRKTSEVKKLCDKLLKKYPNNHTLLEYRGKALMLENKYTQALIFLKKAHKYSKNCKSCIGNLGITYRSLNKTKNAITCFKNVLRIDSTNLIALRQLFLIYSKKKTLDLALGYINKIIKLDNRDFIAYANKGDVLQELKNYNKSIKYYRTALNIHRKVSKHRKSEKCKFQISVNKNIVMALLNLKKYEQGLNLVNEILLMDKNNKTLRILKKEILKKMK